MREEYSLSHHFIAMPLVETINIFIRVQKIQDLDVSIVRDSVVSFEDYVSICGES